jgi:hypothetical protein
MKYYFLKHSLFTPNDKTIEPSPVGFIVIWEVEFNLAKKYFSNIIESQQIVFCAFYEREKKWKYNILPTLPGSFPLGGEREFDSVGDFFKNRNLPNIYSSKSLAIKTAKNLINNILNQFRMKLITQSLTLNENKERYSGFSDMLTVCKNKIVLKEGCNVFADTNN